MLQIDISEYAGYGGLIVANGGLEPNPDSFFAKEYGFQVKISMSESETWSPLNNGRLAATATTTDALAVLGRQFEAVVPVQIGYSRGADMVVVDRGIASVNQLAGKVLAASQFNESEFFIRYLAQEAGVPVAVLRDLDSRPAAGELGLVFYEDAFVACDAYEHELGSDAAAPQRLRRLDAAHRRGRREVERRGEGAGLEPQPARHRRRARGEPAASRKAASRHGARPRARRPRRQPAAARPAGGEHRASSRRRSAGREAEARDELAHVHLANLPENRAFFAGTIDSAGSFGGIFQSSVLAYGSVHQEPDRPGALRRHEPPRRAREEGPVRRPEDRDRADQARRRRRSLEGDPLLSKDIRFFFEPNSAVLDKDAPQNLEYLDTIKRFLQVSPGSTVLLRGHVDNARVPEFREQGGEQLVKSMALKAMELSRQRALAVSEALRERHKEIDASRIEVVGRGWEEPAGADSDLNRRVEVQWFTLE